MRISMTEWIHGELERWIQKGDTCIDATVGKGSDTLFLCQQVGPSGKVIGFDIQKEAIEQTKEKLKKHQVEAQLHETSHENMYKYVKEGTISAIMFNLGYLPGGDHSIATDPETTIHAIDQGLWLLKQKGVMTLCIYSGGDSGFYEKKRVLEHLHYLNDKEYLVIMQGFYNKKNDPPLPIMIIKL